MILFYFYFITAYNIKYILTFYNILYIILLKKGNFVHKQKHQTARHNTSTKTHKIILKDT